MIIFGIESYLLTVIFQSQHGQNYCSTYVHSAMCDSEKRIAASNANKSAGTTQWQWGCKFLTVFLFVSLSSAVRLSPLLLPTLFLFVCKRARTLQARWKSKGKDVGIWERYCGTVAVAGYTGPCLAHPKIYSLSHQMFDTYMKY